jgi:ATP/maltotriose-dependent transcriptional regulator MalT/DNA-binding SARP family transcriptional activator
MPRPRPHLAKLTRPRLHNAVWRERLFALLDLARDERGAICVIGPPGAGKTTLVASWLDARAIRGIWYQVDPGDADLATFFYYLRLAAEAFAGRRRAALPALAPEYLADVPGFARRFFRELFARMPAGASLGLDNYQEVAAQAQFHEIVADAVQEVPQRVALIVVSRRDPPDCYARLIANESVAFLDWEQLRLTAREAREVATARGCRDTARIDALHAQSDGWAAGLTLLLEQAARQDAPARYAQRGHGALFGYFAEQAFRQVSETTGRFLMETAILPTVPVSVAAALTGNPEAASILDDLYRRRLFTHRRAGSEPTYSYHALFREFLLGQARQRLSEAERRAAARRAAPLLAAARYDEDAFELYREAEDWSGAAGLVLERAEAMLASGRWQTLREWIESLPGHELNAKPWLEFWLGNALMPIDQAQARAHLEIAYERLRRQSETLGQMRAAASIIATHFFEWSSWQALDPWIDVLEALVVTHPRYPSDAIEFDIVCAMLIATLYRRPDHALLPMCADRVETLLEAALDLNRKVTGATLLLTYCNLGNLLERGRGVVARTSALIERDEVTPLNRVWWYCRLNYFLCACGRFAEVEAPTRRAHEIIDAHGLKGLRGAAILASAHLQWALLGLRDWNRAHELTLQVSEAAQSSRPSDRWQASQARLRLAMCLGELERAVPESSRALAAARATGMIFLEVLAESDAAEVLAEAGRFDEARAHLLRGRELTRHTCFAYFEPDLLMIEAFVTMRAGDLARCHALLAEGFALARRIDGIWRDTRLFGRVLAAMCGEALSAGIEPDYVRALIRRFGLKAASQDDETWPWPVKIHTLGRFEILREGRAIEFAHKAPRKQLLVLKALLAFGGQDVPARRLTDAIWPDQDGDASWRALGVNLARLRTLLGSQDAITVSDERISLNPDRCWWDARAFERMSAKPAAAGSEAKLLALYRGPFLPGEADQPWTAPLRERLRARFAAHLQRSAARLEAQGAWADAAALFRRGIETEELAEEFYQGLMRCYRALGRPAEGLVVYRRLRQMLSVVLGISPAPESDALYRALQEMGAGQSAEA